MSVDFLTKPQIETIINPDLRSTQQLATLTCSSPMTDELAVALLANTGNSEKKINKILRQFCLYSLVGGLAFCIDFGTLLLLFKYFGLNYRIAGATGFLLGLVVNYTISVIWVFDERSISNRYIEFILYAIVGIFGLFVNDQILYFCTEILNFDPSISKIPAAAIVLIVNFALRKLILFQSSE
jgi:putative flippase GtrA